MKYWYIWTANQRPKRSCFCRALKIRLGAELAVITLSPGPAIEELPSPGVSLPLKRETDCRRGFNRSSRPWKRLLKTACWFAAVYHLKDIPLATCLLERPPRGNDSLLRSFGPLVETLNRLIEEHQVHLLILSPPRRSGLPGLLAGDVSRNLVLDLHTSVLFVRGAGRTTGMWSAPTALLLRRGFPFLKHLLPAVKDPRNFWVKKTEAGDEAVSGQKMPGSRQ